MTEELAPGHAIELETKCKGHFGLVGCPYCPGGFPIGERKFNGEEVIQCPWCKTRFFLTGYGVRIVK